MKNRKGVKLIMSKEQIKTRIAQHESKIEELKKDLESSDSIKYLQAMDGIEYYNELIDELNDYINKKYR